MADFYDSTAPETVKLWAKKTWWDHRKASSMFDPANGLVGDDYRKYPIVMDDTFEGGPGDEVTITLSHLIGGRGTVGAEQLEGKEQIQETSTFKYKVDVLRHAVKEMGAMINPQRVPFKIMDNSSKALRDWFDERRTVMAINHLCGNSRQTDLAYTGNNTVSEPDTRHIYRVGYGLGTSNDQTVGGDSTAKFDVDILDELVTIAEGLTPPVKPWIYKGNPYYGIMLHPNVIRELRKTSTKWYDEMKAALQGGYVKDNPIFGRALGMHRNVLIFEEPYIVQGKNSSTGAAVSNCRRNVFFGAGAITMGYGLLSKSGDSDRLVWNNAVTDGGMRLHVFAAMSVGCKAIEFKDLTNTTRSHGRIVVSSYAPENSFPYEIAAGPLGVYVETYDKGQPQ